MDKDKTQNFSMYDVMLALNDSIWDLYGLNLHTGELVVYKQTGKAKSIYEGLALNEDYESIASRYIDNNVFEEDREAMRNFMRLDNLKNLLRNSAKLVYHYRLFRDEAMQYFYLKCVRIGSGSNPDMIVFAFIPEAQDANREKLLDLIEIDDLTGVFTKQAFYHHARRILEAYPNEKYSIIMVDIVNFKQVNSIYGEKKGDEVLKYIAEYVSDFIEEGGISGRYGGDKFIGIAKHHPEMGKEWFSSVVNNAGINCPVPNIKIKCGIYGDVDRNLPISVMADRALLAIKSIKGKYAIPYVMYDEKVIEANIREQNLEDRFKSAVQNKEFKVWYQPKCRAENGKVVGAEALVRWKMDDGTFISPGEFIPIFERDGLIVQLDEYVFREVCEQMARWRESGVALFPVSVNLSRASLHEEGTVEKYTRIIEEYGIPKEYVPLEITESATVYSREIEGLMNNLKRKGFALHMDDFGSGVSSLASINILPFDVVKLDKGLIDLIGDRSGDELVRHTIELSHFNEMTVVAEGVETKNQLELLKKLNCDTIQGYFFSPPVPSDKALEYVSNNR